MQFIFSILLIGTIYFTSQYTIKSISLHLSKNQKTKKLILPIVSILLFPGTILHELSHFLAATVLFLKVRDISILPSIEGTNIKLGKVLYVKKDPIRGALVGIAPVIGGIYFFWLINIFNLFPSDKLLFNIIFGYLIFAVSTTMFSSSQDLIDGFVFIPLAVLVGAILYISNLDNFTVNLLFVLYDGLNNFLKSVNFNLLITMIVHVVVAFFLKVKNTNI